VTQTKHPRIEEPLHNLARHAVEMALEDGGTRDFVTETVGLTAKITDYNVSADGITVTLDNGQTWVIEQTVRRVSK